MPDIRINSLGAEIDDAVVKRHLHDNKTILDQITRLPVDGRPVEFNVSGTMLQWRHAGDTTWTNLLSIPQPALVFSPHLWPVNAEVNLGDGSYGYRAVGTVTAASATQVNVTTGIPDGISPIDLGGWWASSSTRHTQLNASSTSDPTSASGYWSTFWSPSFRSRSYQERTNSPFDIWIRYTKESV